MKGGVVAKKSVLRRVLLVVVSLVALLSLALGLAGCGEKQVKLVLDVFELTLAEGESTALVPTVENGEAEKIVWNTSDPAVATVSDVGKVTAVKEGTATIKATLGTEEASCVVTVTSNTMPTIVPDREQVELVVGGESITAAADVLYGGETVTAALTWTSQDPEVCTVADGVISPVGVGETTVTIACEYAGKAAQASISVKVNPDLNVSVSASEVTLVTAELSEGDKTKDNITVTVQVNGEAVQNAAVNVSTQGTSASATYEAGVLHVQAVEEGDTQITLTYTQDGVTTKTMITVHVLRPYQQLNKVFTANIKDPAARLDFSEYEWKELVTGVYAGDTLISTQDDVTLLSAEWLANGIVGTQVDIRIQTQEYDLYAKLELKNDLATILYQSAGNASTYEKTSDTVEAFAGVADVYKWTTSRADHWEDRLNIASSVSEYGYWIFDIVLTQPIEETLTFWVANNHVVQLTAGGGTVMLEKGGYAGTPEQHAGESCLRVFDATGRIVIGAMKANERYTIEIDLAHRGDRDIYDMGVAQATTIYIANAFACTKAYYDENIGPYRITEVQSDIELSVEKNIPTTYALDFSSYPWKDTVEGIYADEVKISAEGAPATLDTTWLAAANVGTVEVVIKLTSGESINALLHVKNSVLPVPFASTDTRYSSFAVTEDEVAALSGVSPIYKWNSLQENVWNTRIKSQTNLASYNYWMFDIVLTTALTQDITFWIGTNHAIHIKADGSIVLAEAGSNYGGSADQHATENCVRIFDAEGKIVIGAMKANEKYTIEVDLVHKGNGDAFAAGLGNITNVYVANAIACTKEYYDEHIAPTRDYSTPELTFSVEKYLSDTHTLDFARQEWENSVEGVYYNGQRITDAGSANALSATWMADVVPGLKLITIRLTDEREITAVLNVKAGILPYEFYMPGDSGTHGSSYTAYEGDVTQIGFAAGTQVFEYNSGTQPNNNWGNRISANRGLGDQDWWLFDIVFAEDIFTGDAAQKLFVIWIGSGHVLELYANGAMIIYGESSAHEPNCITIRDASGNAVTGALQANVKYTFEISLAHKGSLPLFEIGAYAVTRYYVANCYSCTDEYYQAHIAAGDAQA